tara:strand:+ start:824 stop:1909 length:1086 start_codon:yes stop_codon:yes gene_type:complete
MSEFVNIDGKNVKAEELKNNWAVALMTKGIIVRLKMSRWRATAPLRFEELGLRFDDDNAFKFMKKYVQLGSEKLLPPEILNELNGIETKSRTNLKNHSFETIWGNFIPYTAFNNWEEIDNVCKEDYYEAAKKLSEKYDEIVAVVKQEYKILAADVWSRQNPNVEPPASFIDEFVAKIIAKIPSQTDIVKSFKYDITYFTIPIPSIVAEDMAKAKDIAISSDKKEHSAQLEKEAQEKIAQKYLERKEELVDSFLEATVTSMRNYVGDLCDSVIFSLNNNSKNDINKNQVRKIQTMIKKVRLLNFHDDKEINSSLNELETEILKFKGQRNKGEILDKLEKISEIGAREFAIEEFDPIMSTLEF